MDAFLCGVLIFVWVLINTMWLLQWVPIFMECLLTLGACAARVTVLGLCVCVSVCVSVIQHLTFDMFIRATNDTNLLGGG